MATLTELTTTKLNIFSSEYDADLDQTTVKVRSNIDLEATDVNIYSSRFTVNGVIDTSQSPIAALEDLLAAGAGTMPFAQGKYLLVPGVYNNATTYTIDQDSLAGPVSVSGSLDSSNLVNTITGTIRNPANDWEESTFYQQSSQTYIDEDGGYELKQNVTYPFTTSAFDAQRLARISLQRSRFGQSATLVCNLSAVEIPVGAIVEITLPELGWTAETFSVVSWSFQEGKVTLQVRQEDPTAYAWLNTTLEAVKYTPTSSFSSLPRTDLVTGLTMESGTDTLMKLADSSIVPRVLLKWVYPEQDSGTYLEVELRIGITSALTEIRNLKVRDLEAGQLYIDNIKEDDFVTVRVRTRVDDPNIEAEVDTWVTAVDLDTPANEYHTVVGKSEAPTNPTGLTATTTLEAQVRLDWLAPSPVELDFSHIELWRATTNDWAGGSPSLIATSISTTYIDIFEGATSNYFYWVRAVDTTDNVSIRNPNANTGVTGAAIAISAGSADSVPWSGVTDDGARPDNNADVTNDQLAGSGINIANYKYSVFDSIRPTDMLNVSSVDTYDSTNKYFGDWSLKLQAASAFDSILYLGPTSSSYNIRITPNKKWIVSAYVMCDVTARNGQIFLRPEGETALAIDFTTDATAGVWTRVSGSIDFSSYSATDCMIRLDSDAGNPNSIWFDGIMVEEQVGTLETPSAYALPAGSSQEYNDLDGIPTSLADLDSDQDTKLDGIDPGADVTADVVQVHQCFNLYYTTNQEADPGAPATGSGAYNFATKTLTPPTNWAETKATNAGKVWQVQTCYHGVGEASTTDDGTNVFGTTFSLFSYAATAGSTWDFDINDQPADSILLNSYNTFTSVGADEAGSAATAETNAIAHTDSTTLFIETDAYNSTDNGNVYQAQHKVPYLMFQIGVGSTGWPASYGGVISHWYATQRATQVCYSVDGGVNESEEWTREINPTSWPDWSAWKEKEIYTNSDIDVLQTTNAPLEAGAQGNSAFSELFNKEGPLDDNWLWGSYSGSGEMSISTDSYSGGSSLLVGDNSGNDQQWLIGNKSYVYNPTKLYKMTVVAKTTAGTGICYFGIAGRDITDTLWVNTTGVNSYSSQHFLVASNELIPSSYTTYIGYFTGYGTPVNGENNTIDSPSPLHADVRHFRPLVLVNYNAEAGTTYVDSVTIEESDANTDWEGVVGTNAPENNATENTGALADLNEITTGEIAAASETALLNTNTTWLDVDGVNQTAGQITDQGGLATKSNIDLSTSEATGNLGISQGGTGETVNTTFLNSYNTITSSETLTVGSGGTYSTINDALVAVTKKYPTYASTPVRVTVELQGAYNLSEQTFVDGIDLSWVTITSVDSVVDVDISSGAGYTKSVFFLGINWLPVFAAINGGKFPLVDVSLDASLETETRLVMCMAYSIGSVLEIRNDQSFLARAATASVTGLMASNGGRIGATGVVTLTDFLTPLRVENSSIVQVYRLVVIDARHTGIYCQSGSLVAIGSSSDIDGASATYGVFCDSMSNVECSFSLDLTGTFTYGLYARAGARINAAGSGIVAGSTYKYSVLNGSFISAKGAAAGTSNVTVNALTVDGAIFL